MECYYQLIVICILLQNGYSLSNHKSVGCYEEYLDGKIQKFQEKKSNTECVHLCIEAYYRYSYVTYN